MRHRRGWNHVPNVTNSDDFAEFSHHHCWPIVNTDSRRHSRDSRDRNRLGWQQQDHGHNGWHSDRYAGRDDDLDRYRDRCQRYHPGDRHRDGDGICNAAFQSHCHANCKSDQHSRGRQLHADDSDDQRHGRADHGHRWQQL